MKYNSTYTPKVNFKDTVIFSNDLKNKILLFFKKKYKIIDLMSPVFYEINDPNNLEIDIKTRGITFDSISEYKVNRLSLSNSSYLRKMATRLDLKPNEAVYSEFNSVWRDLPETPVSTISKYELTFQIVFNNENKKEMLKDFIIQFYNFIFKIAQEVEIKFNEKNIWPEIPSFISSQMLENEMTDKNFKDREIEMVLEKDAFILENPSSIMFSGHIHTELPKAIYEVDNFYQILMKDKINSFVLKVASIAVIATGKKLSSQIVSESSLIKESSEYIELLKSEKNIFEIKINLPKLVMALLGKGHIAEVQPSVFGEEAKIVKSKYKIETY